MTRLRDGGRFRGPIGGAAEVPRSIGSERGPYRAFSELRRSMAMAHTWAGLVPGWVLFLVFLFGTTAFFQQETSRWMRPELAGGGPTAAALDAATAWLEAHAPGAASWAIALPPARGGDPVTVSWQSTDRGGSQAGSATLDPVTGRVIAVRDTQGGWFLYRFHYDLHYVPWWLGRYIVCAAALAMLVTILSGIVIHKRIFADFFVLRFGKGQRSWLDAHTAAGVLALPFHVMITYTGLVSLLFTLMPWAIDANFPSDDAFYTATDPPAPQAPATGKAAPLLSLPELIARAGFGEGAGIMPSYVSVSHPGDAAAIVALYRAHSELGGDRQAIYLSGATGELLRPLHWVGAASATRDAMIDLHTGLFAGAPLRWLYSLSGLSGTIMIASGLVLWTVKRRARLPEPERPGFGFRLVERLNIATIAGAPAGIAAYFLANRLLPVDLSQRSGWEVSCLFLGWGTLLAWTIARPARRAWIEALAVGAGLYALVPIANALTTARGLVPSLTARDWVFAGFDLTMLAVAGMLALAAWKIAARTPGPGRRRASRGLAGAAA